MSMSRHSAIYQATDDKYYIELAHNEYEGREDADCYGPFDTYAEAEAYFDNFSNTGGLDDYGIGLKVPAKAPNGSEVQYPKSHNRRFF